MTDNNKNMLEEFNVYYLFRNLWLNRILFISLVSLFALGSIIYSLAAENKYMVGAVIKPADAKEETTLNDKAPIMGFGVGGYTTYPVVNDIMITLKSDTFLELLLNKYQNEERIFRDELTKMDEEISDENERILMKRFVGIKILRKALDFSVDSDHNTIIISVILRDRNVAYNFMNDLLDNLRTYVRDQNIRNLESDIQFFEEMTEKTEDPRILQALETKLAEKIERKFNMSSNVFTVTDKPVIPAKRIFPKRTFIVVVTTTIGFLLSMAAVSLIPQIKKIINFIKDN